MLENWLQPSEKQDINYDKYQLGSSILQYLSEFPFLDKTKVALIGTRKSIASQIKYELFSLSNVFENDLIADIGFLRNSGSSFTTNLIKEINDSKIIPIFYDLETDSHLGMKALNGLEGEFSAGQFTSRIDQNTHGFAIEKDYENLTSLKVLGYQGHLSDPAVIQDLNNYNNHTLRLGMLKDNIAEAEPWIREIHSCNIDLSCIRFSDCSAQQNAPISGFNADEITQICRYLGYNEHLKFLSISGYAGKLERNQHSAKLIAQMIWYFIEGLNSRLSQIGEMSEHLKEYHISLKDHQMVLIFFKGEQTGRWWFSFESNSTKIPCSYLDYESCSQQILSDRIKMHIYT